MVGNWPWPRVCRMVEYLKSIYANDPQYESGHGFRVLSYLFMFTGMGPHHFKSRLQFQDIRYRDDANPFAGMTGLRDRNFDGSALLDPLLQERKWPHQELSAKQMCCCRHFWFH